MWRVTGDAAHAARCGRCRTMRPMPHIVLPAEEEPRGPTGHVGRTSPFAVIRGCPPA